MSAPQACAAFEYASRVHGWSSTPLLFLATVNLLVSRTVSTEKEEKSDATSLTQLIERKSKLTPFDAAGLTAHVTI